MVNNGDDFEMNDTTFRHIVIFVPKQINDRQSQRLSREQEGKYFFMKKKFFKKKIIKTNCKKGLLGGELNPGHSRDRRIYLTTILPRTHEKTFLIDF